LCWFGATLSDTRSVTSMPRRVSASTFFGADLVDQANASAFLTQVQQHTAASGGDRPQSTLQLLTTIAAKAEQCVAGKTFRVHSCEHRVAVVDFPHRQHYMFMARSAKRARHASRTHPRPLAGGRRPSRLTRQRQECPGLKELTCSVRRHTDIHCSD